MKTITAFALVTIFSAFCQAATFDAEPGEMRADVNEKTGKVIISWIKVGNIVTLEQYLTRSLEGKWILRHKAENNTASFNGFIGDRFNVINDKGRYLMLTPEMAVSKLKTLKLEGISIECSDSDGCVLQISPTK